MYKYIVIILVTISFSSCFKKDEKVTPHNPGDVETATIPLTRYYSNQVYFSLEKQDIVSINIRSLFDLNLDCSDSSTTIRLNTADFAMAAETKATQLQDVTDTTGLIWKFDASDGELDSLAISNWIEVSNGDTTYSNKVWVINRGVNSQGVSLGLVKIKFTGFRLNTYSFSYSNMDNSNRVEAVVDKDSLASYVQYSFDSESVTQYEPELNNWDLLFTQYTTMLTTSEGELYPYLLTGVLQNQARTRVAFDTLMDFNDIVLADTISFGFSKSLDKIGYNWKKLIGDVNTGNIYYEVKLNYNYIIYDGSSYYYKLRFTSFYDFLTGEKGYPTFEYQKL